VALYSLAQGGLVNASDSQQLINLLTGVMTDQTVTLSRNAGTALLVNWLGAAGTLGVMAIERGGTPKYYLGLDASDNFALLNAAGTNINMRVDASGNTTIAGSLVYTFANPYTLAAAALAGAQTL